MLAGGDLVVDSDVVAAVVAVGVAEAVGMLDGDADAAAVADGGRVRSAAADFPPVGVPVGDAVDGAAGDREDRGADGDHEVECWVRVVRC